jgi:hypothetical protein
MRLIPSIEYIHEGRLVAEVDVTLIDTDHEWAPYFSMDDVRKLESARAALKRGDLVAAAKLGRVFELMPVAAE